jgi:hypothetical protein
MTFEEGVDAFGRSVKVQIDLIRRKMALEIFSRVVKRTPVDTGRARANWQVSVGEPIFEAIEDTDKKRFGAGPGADRVMAADASMRNLPLDKSIFITNNLPYIVYLEDGTPKMKAFGMVKTTLAEANAVWGNVAKEARR